MAADKLLDQELYVFLESLGLSEFSQRLHRREFREPRRFTVSDLVRQSVYSLLSDGLLDEGELDVLRKGLASGGASLRNDHVAIPTHNLLEVAIPRSLGITFNLLSEGYWSVHDIARVKPWKLLEVHNIGPTKLNEIRKILASRGLHLAGEEVWVEPIVDTFRHDLHATNARKARAPYAVTWVVDSHNAETRFALDGKQVRMTRVTGGGVHIPQGEAIDKVTERGLWPVGESLIDELLAAHDDFWGRRYKQLLIFDLESMMPDENLVYRIVITDGDAELVSVDPGGKVSGLDWIIVVGK